MGAKNIIANELIDVIDWTEGEGEADVLSRKFTRPGNAIKMGARLTVREGQVAVFVNEGRVADVFRPGMYRLQTSNLPVLTSLRSWVHGFDTPFKADVYFVATTVKAGLKWGTATPLLLRDKELGMVRARAYGSYGLQVTDPARFLTRLIGTSPDVETLRVEEYFRPVIVSAVADALGRAAIPILEMVGNYEKIGAHVRDEIKAAAAEWGFALPQFVVESISLPPKVEEAVDKRTSMEIVGDLDRFARYQTAEAVREASQGKGGDGTAGVGAGLGAGMVMAQQMAVAFAQGAPAGSPAAVPPALSFHAVVQGQKLGPLGWEEMKALILSERMKKDDLVWRPGLAVWIAAKDLPELADLFAQIPPPLPQA